MQKRIILIAFLVLGIVLVSGCTSPQNTAPASPVTAIPTSLSTDIPVTQTSTGPFSPDITFRPQGQPPAPGVVTEQTTRIQTDNPHLEYFNIRKNTYDSRIPNCIMQNAFPAIANDPYYGINQLNPKLSTLTKDQYDQFLWKYTAGKSENSLLNELPECRGVEGNPEWNFVEILVILNPTNVKPSPYTITEVVRSNGEIIAQFSTTRTLVIDDKIALTSYVPVKADEMDLFGTVGLTYTRQ
jgi:hypothetical protein